MGDPTAVRVGPGTLYIAPVGSTEPTDLASAWDAAWTDLGYTEDGHAVNLEQTFEDVPVAEELEPVAILQTARNLSVSFSLAEMTADNFNIAMNGGTVTVGATETTFEPPAAGTFTYMALGWESDDGLERMVFRKGINTGSGEIARRKAPQKALIPVQFRFVKPSGQQSFVYIHDSDYAAA